MSKKMLVLQSHQCLFSSSTSTFSLPHHLCSTRLISLYRPPESIYPTPSLSAFTRIRPNIIRVSAAKEIADVADVNEEEGEDGPIELPPLSSLSPFSSTNSICATSDDPSPLQLATSVLPTSAITVFLFRSLRQRAKRSKELTFRSSGAKKSLKEEAMENLKAMGSTSIEGGKSTPSAAQAFLGAISVGVIGLILYKFTTTTESTLNHQTISDNFSVSSFSLFIAICLCQGSTRRRVDGSSGSCSACWRNAVVEYAGAVAEVDGEETHEEESSDQDHVDHCHGEGIRREKDE